MQEEIWKDVPGYENYYQVSDQGNVRSLHRKIWNGKGFYEKKEKILKPFYCNDGYKVVDLRLESRRKTIKVHQLVAMAFLNHKPCGMKILVDHINNIKTDNSIENLQLVTNRYNASKDKKCGTSKYTGVSLDKRSNKWTSRIHNGEKYKFLGYFNCETAAHLAYQEELIKLNK